MTQGTFILAACFSSSVGSGCLVLQEASNTAVAMQMGTNPCLNIFTFHLDCFG
jgi:hypothetical protein